MAHQKLHWQSLRVELDLDLPTYVSDSMVLYINLTGQSDYCNVY